MGKKKTIDQKRDDIEKSQKKHQKWFGYLFFIILISWLCYYGLMEFLFSSLKLNEFGDPFGALNTLFSGFAFLGVVYAIILQKEELQYQRLELEMTREELKGSRKALLASSKALELQNKTQEIQRFENTFFNLLRLYQEVVDGMHKGKADKKISGRQFIDSVVHDIGFGAKNAISDLNYSDAVNLFIKFYDYNYQRESNQLGHYFRNLYRIFNFIDNSMLSEENKGQYAKIIRAQFSDSEVLLLFYNSMNDLGLGKNFREYIIKYELLNNIDMSQFNKEYKFQLVSQYLWPAYGPSDQNKMVF